MIGIIPSLLLRESYGFTKGATNPLTLMVTKALASISYF
jgi:hypothetical protein